MDIVSCDLRACAVRVRRFAVGLAKLGVSGFEETDLIHFSVCVDASSVWYKGFWVI